MIYFLFSEFPEKRPSLFTEHTRYEPGDVLRANCSTLGSRPRADLRFTINNIPVSNIIIKHPKYRYKCKQNTITCQDPRVRISVNSQDPEGKTLYNRQLKCLTSCRALIVN